MKRVSSRRGFTLVELLVVIGMIAVLMAMLLPAVNKARVASIRVACLANLHEIYNTMRLYGAESRDACPIGYVDQEQLSHIANWNVSTGPIPKPMQMGVLFLTKAATNPKVFYCPAEVDGRVSFDTPENPWPRFDQYPNDPAFKTPGYIGSVSHTYLGYNSRPVANWPLDVGSTTDSAFWLPVLAPNPGQSHVGTVGLPHLARLKNKALVADLVVTRSYVTRRHRTGINVLYANGSARWVALSSFDKPRWNTIADNSLNTISNNWNDDMLNERIDPVNHPAATGVWADLDAAP